MLKTDREPVATLDGRISVYFMGRGVVRITGDIEQLDGLDMAILKSKFHGKPSKVNGKGYRCEVGLETPDVPIPDTNIRGTCVTYRIKQIS